MKICPVGLELFHAGRQTDRQTDRKTDMTKLIVTFLNFANEPKNLYQIIDCRLVNFSINQVT